MKPLKTLAIFKLVVKHINNSIDSERTVFRYKDKGWEEGEPFYIVLVHFPHGSQDVTATIYDGQNWNKKKKIKVDKYRFEIEEMDPLPMMNMT